MANNDANLVVNEENKYLIIVNYIHYRDKQQLNINHDFNNNLKKYISFKLNSNTNLTIRLPEYDINYENMKSHSDSVMKTFIKFVSIIVNFLTKFLKLVSLFLKITSTNQGLLKRKVYINEFKEVFSTSIVEYDSKYYYFASSLISHEDFYCLLKSNFNN